MAVKGRYAGSGDGFMKMVAGALVGAACGFLLGHAIFFQLEGTRVLMDIVGAMIGSIVGFSVVRLFTGGKKVAPAAADPKAQKGKSEKKA
jgi:F0F1-type ATP synthase assembly protein I